MDTLTLTTNGHSHRDPHPTDSVVDYLTDIEHELETLQTKVRDLVSALDSPPKTDRHTHPPAISARYSAVADRERRQADIWRLVSVALATTVAGVAFYFALHSGNQELNTNQILGKIFACLTLGGIATYAGRQSAGHRQVERETQNVAVQLDALKSYADTIDAGEERNTLLLETGQRLFGQERSLPEVDHAAGDPSSVTQMTELLAELVKLVKK